MSVLKDESLLRFTVCASFCLSQRVILQLHRPTVTKLSHMLESEFNLRNKFSYVGATSF